MSSAETLVQLEAETLGRACHPLVERRKWRLQQACQCQVLGIVGLGPGGLVRLSDDGDPMGRRAATPVTIP